MTKEYYEIRDLEKSPFYDTTNVVGRCVTLSTPSVTIRNAAGVFVEPFDKENNYNIRSVKVVDPSGQVLFEVSMHAAERKDNSDEY